MKLFEKIEGYADLSVEEKLAKLESFEEMDSKDLEKQLAEQKAEAIKWKETSNKISSEVSKYKKELQAKMTDEEKAKVEREEYQKSMEEKLAYYERAEKTSTLKAQYLALGYDEALAQQKAEAVIDNDMVKANEIEKEFVSNIKKLADQNAMRNQPSVTVGKALTQQDLDAQEQAQLRKWAGL